MAGIVIPHESSPLTWPSGVPRTSKRRTSQFRHKSVARGLKLVYEELRRLRAQRPIISSNLPPRQDGLPSTRDRDVVDVGVAVYWVMPTRLGAHPYCLYCDRWETVGENLLAIGNTIKTLRDVERWGRSSSSKPSPASERFPPATSLPRPPGERSSARDRLAGRSCRTTSCSRSLEAATTSSCAWTTRRWAAAVKRR